MPLNKTQAHNSCGVTGESLPTARGMAVKSAEHGDEKTPSTFWGFVLRGRYPPRTTRIVSTLGEYDCYNF